MAIVKEPADESNANYIEKPMRPTAETLIIAGVCPRHVAVGGGIRPD